MCTFLTGPYEPNFNTKEIVLSVGGKSRRLDLFLCCVASLLHMQRLVDSLTTVF